MESEELKKAKLELVSKFNEYVKLGGVVYTSIEEEFEGQLRHYQMTAFILWLNIKEFTNK